MNKRILLLALVSTIGYTHTDLNNGGWGRMAMLTRSQMPKIQMDRNIMPLDLLYLNLRGKSIESDTLKRQFNALAKSLKKTQMGPAKGKLLTEMQKIRMLYAFLQLPLDDQMQIQGLLNGLELAKKQYRNAEAAFKKAMEHPSNTAVTDAASAAMTRASVLFASNKFVQQITKIFNSNMTNK